MGGRVVGVPVFGGVGGEYVTSVQGMAEEGASEGAGKVMHETDVDFIDVRSECLPRRGDGESRPARHNAASTELVTFIALVIVLSILAHSSTDVGIARQFAANTPSQARHDGGGT